MSRSSSSSGAEVPFIPVEERYRVVGPPMEGGMAIVRRAVDRQTGETVAIKRVHRYIQLDRGLMERFHREARSGGGLRHPGILRQVGEARDDKGEYLVLEWAGGGSLMELLERDGKLPVEEVLSIARRIGGALQYAHEKGFVHRDVKPHNILLDDDGVPKLADFGLARAAGDVTLTASLGSAGSPLYMSPEQLLMSRQADGRSDLYSLAKTLYHLATGLQPVSIKPKLIPRPLRRPLMRCLQDKPDDRYQSVGDFLKALDGAGSPFALGPVGWTAVGCSAVVVAALTAALFVHGDARALLPRDAPSAAEASTRDRIESMRIEVDELRARLGVADEDLRVDLDEIDALRSGQERASRLRSEESRVEATLGDLRRSLEETRSELEDLATAAERALARAELLADLGVAVPIEDAKAAYDAGVVARDAQREGDAVRHFLDASARVEPADQGDLARRIIARVEETSLDVDAAASRAALADLHALAVELGVDAEVEPVVTARLAWADAIVDIADSTSSPEYAGLTLSPIDGLVPLGRDDVTRLWEFWHVASGNRPVSDPGRGHRVTSGSGLVLVLVPGGTYHRGAQRKRRTGTNYDPDARPNEGPVVRESLGPFLISKYEITEGQAGRLLGEDGAGGVLPARLSFADATSVADAAGLSVPDEREWEYACRARSSLPWFSRRNRLHRYANLADRAARAGGVDAVEYESGDDGFAALAPVGSLSGNLYGLFDMHGNVAEWCVAPDGSPSLRGGSYRDAASGARTTARVPVAGGARGDVTGVRLARHLPR